MSSQKISYKVVYCQPWQLGPPTPCVQCEQ